MVRFTHLLTVSLIVLAGCTAHKGFVRYDSLGVYATDQVGNKKFEDIGPVATDASDFIWASCDTVAKAAVRDLLDLAKSRGGNTVYKIMFDSDNGLVSTPTCYKRWGWFVLYIVPGLGPWMTHTAVEGIAAKLNAPSPGNAIFIPSGADTDKLAADYVQSLLHKR